MNILITGVSGLLGNELVRQMLPDQTINITGIVHSRGIRDIETYYADILDYEKLENVFQKKHYDVVIHMAAISDYLSSTDKKHETFRINMQGTVNMLELFNRYCKNALFLYTSSCKVYGKTNEMPISERALVNPLTVVGKSKCIAEKIIDFYVQQNNKYLIVRPFNIYGGKQKESFLIPTLIRQLKKSDTLKLGNIYDKRDYIYVKDVASALISCIEKRQTFPALDYINIGSESPHSVEDIIKIFDSLLDRNIEVQIDSGKVRKDETSIEVSDCTRLKQRTGWHPQYTLEDAIKEICYEEKMI